MSQATSKKRPRSSSKEKTATPTIKIVKEARKKAHSYHETIQKLKADAQTQSPNVDLIRKLSEENFFRVKIMTQNHCMEIMDLVNTIVATKSPVGFMHNANANLTSLLLVGQICTTLLNCKPNANVRSPVAAVRLTLGDRSTASNRDLMRIGALYSFEKMLLLPRRILISTLANSLHKMNLNREILLCAAVFVNGSKNRFQILLPLFAQAGVERVEKVLVLKQSEKKLIENYENSAREESPEPMVNHGGSDEELEDTITLHSSDEEYAD